jgi:uncharacterized membrane protein YheB (UPF0754 family)
MLPTYITAPAVGALIGYITNFIAIKMLFRPLNPKYILGLKLPFTPGIIPREKDRLAKSIGNAVGAQLLNSDVIVSTLTSSHFRESVEGFIDEKLQNVKLNKIRIDDILIYTLNANEAENLQSTIKNELSKFMSDRISSPETSEKLTTFMQKALHDYIGNQFDNPMIKMMMSLNPGIADSIVNFITEKIKQILVSNSSGVIDEFINDEFEKFMDTPLSNMLDNFEDELPNIKKSVFDAFIRTIENNSEVITSALNLPKIIEDRVHDLDVLEVETLILSVVEKELKAIIWLGALLGMLMGFLMPLFS